MVYTLRFIYPVACRHLSSFQLGGTMNTVAMSIHCLPFDHVYMKSRNLTSWICSFCGPCQIVFLNCCTNLWGFPGGSAVKNLPANTGDVG